LPFLSIVSIRMDTRMTRPARAVPILALFLLCSLVLTAADVQLLGMVPPEAKVVGGINVALAKNSPLGQLLLARAQNASGDFYTFIQLTGFDPSRDIQEVVFASDGATNGSHGLALARGVFDGPKIMAAARARGAWSRSLGGDAGESTLEIYKGIEILSLGERGSLAFPDGTIALGGDLALVRGAIDRLNRTPAFDPRILAKVQEWSALQDVWMISTAPVPVMPGGLPNPLASGGVDPNLLAKLERTALGLKFGAVNEIAAEALMENASDAAALAGLLGILNGLAQMNPQLKNPGAELFRGLQIRAEANLVKVNLGIPQQQLEDLLKRPAQRPRDGRRRALRL
jgi:hypothetical protein